MCLKKKKKEKEKKMQSKVISKRLSHIINSRVKGCEKCTVIGRSAHIISLMRELKRHLTCRYDSEL